MASQRVIVRVRVSVILRKMDDTSLLGVHAGEGHARGVSLHLIGVHHLGVGCMRGGGTYDTFTAMTTHELDSSVRWCTVL